MSLVDLVLLVAATTSLTRLMTHDTITSPTRAWVMRRGAERTVFTADRPSGPRWESIHDSTDATAGWYRRPAWYTRMLTCARYCAPFWAALAVAGMWSADSSWTRWPVLALGLRGIHATVWPLVADQFGES